ncbi:hypothetical protein HB943_05320 [Listeria weihenstephanensis]|uniref:Uncharacterized protein n=1 Tax=Listeria weihenstephanensis TaxID=1006155 RepID=A0A841Z6P2_9LIST|nr:hypothetical protein [Listeria weihenstephanensis]MBC1500016.1 hypothetical protein [Listeria weihenstephanensis]
MNDFMSHLLIGAPLTFGRLTTAVQTGVIAVVWIIIFAVVIKFAAKLNLVKIISTFAVGGIISFLISNYTKVEGWIDWILGMV